MLLPHSGMLCPVLVICFRRFRAALACKGMLGNVWAVWVCVLNCLVCFGMFQKTVVMLQHALVGECFGMFSRVAMCFSIIWYFGRLVYV